MSEARIPSWEDVKVTLDALERISASPITVKNARHAIYSAFGGRFHLPKYHLEMTNGKWKKAKPVSYDLLLSRHSNGDYDSIGVIVNPDSGPCRMEGCTGHRMYVRWGDGKRTYPCWKGVKNICPGVFQIE